VVWVKAASLVRPLNFDAGSFVYVLQLNLFRMSGLRVMILQLRTRIENRLKLM